MWVLFCSSSCTCTITTSARCQLHSRVRFSTIHSRRKGNMHGLVGVTVLSFLFVQINVTLYNLNGDSYQGYTLQSVSTKQVLSGDLFLKLTV